MDSPTPQPPIFQSCPTALEGIDPSVVDEVLMGCVLQAGLGQNPARQIALGAGCPDHVTAMTINKVCGSGLEAAMQADRAIRCQDARVVLCGGAENMTRAPHTGLIRPGAKFGPATFADHMQADGLTCAFKGWAMGNAAEWISNEHNISREDQDAFPPTRTKAAAAAAAGHFDAETRCSRAIGNRKSGTRRWEGQTKACVPIRRPKARQTPSGL